MAVLLKPILNQMLQAEMTEHRKAEPDEETDDRRGYRNGSYKQKLTTRVGTIEREVPQDRDGIFETRPSRRLFSSAIRGRDGRVRPGRSF